MKLPPPVRGLRAATVFLTRIPVGGFPYAPADWRWSTAWFPFVGLLLGFALAGVWTLGRCAGPWPAAILTVGAALLLTGAFHEDGLADTADALGGGFDRQRVLEILKDSRVGAFGASALTIALLLRTALLATLDDQAPVAIIISQSVARTPPIWLMAALPYATPQSASKSRDVARAGLAQAAGGSIWPVMILASAGLSGSLSATQLLFVVAAGVVIAMIAAAWFRARVGGITGDFLGATEQVTECVTLFVLAATCTAAP